jgi:hypothetical protein
LAALLALLNAVLRVTNAFAVYIKDIKIVIAAPTFSKPEELSSNNVDIPF